MVGASLFEVIHTPQFISQVFNLDFLDLLEANRTDFALATIAVLPLSNGLLDSYGAMRDLDKGFAIRSFKS